MEAVEELLVAAEDLLQMGIPEKALQISQPILSHPAYKERAILLAAKSYCKLGDYQAAIEFLKRVEDSSSLNNEVYFWLGYAYLHVNHFKQAIEHFKKHLKQVPGHEQGILYLGMAMLENENVEEAIAVLKEGWQSYPNNLFIRSYLGAAYFKAKIYQNAYTHLKAIVDASPNPLKDWTATYLAHTCKALKNKHEAREYYQKALSLNPNNEQALNNLGTLLIQKNEPQKALPLFKRLLEINPHEPVYYFNCGNAHRATGRLQEAVRFYRQAVEKKPDFVEARYNLAKVLTDLGQFEEAALHFQEVTSLKADIKEVWINYVYVLQELGKVEQALEVIKGALHWFPDDITLRWNRGVLNLLLGRYEDGWPDYELRVQMGQTSVPQYPFPRWSGDPIPDKTLLIYNDQGLGDAIQFFRFVKHIRSKVGTILLQIPTALVRLLAYQKLVDGIIVNENHIPEADFQIPIGSLPGILNVKLNEVHTSGGYLKVDPNWNVNIPNFNPQKFNVGIVWRGNPRHKRDMDRSCDLEVFAPLVDLPEIQLYSLQKGEGLQELQQVSFRHQIISVGHLLRDMADTAAVIQQMDLVISVDTSVAHLAAAMGKPTWILLQFAPDWRWLLEREDSPWYSSVRLFRQKRWRDWQGVLAEVRKALVQMLQYAALKK